MRKKWTYVAIVSMMLGVAPVFTGCVDTDEPAGLSELRGAKAELLRAKAAVQEAKAKLVAAKEQYKLQEAAFMQARADFAAQQAREYELRNDLLEAQTEYEKQKAEAAYNAYLEELARNKEILDKQLEATLLGIEEEIATSKLEIEKLRQQLELAKISGADEVQTIIGDLQDDVDVAYAELYGGEIDGKPVTGAVQELFNALKAQQEALIYQENGFDCTVTRYEDGTYTVDASTGTNDWVATLEALVEIAETERIAAEKLLNDLETYNDKEVEGTDWKAEVEAIQAEIDKLKEQLSVQKAQLSQAQATPEYLAALQAVEGVWEAAPQGWTPVSGTNVEGYDYRLAGEDKDGNQLYEVIVEKGASQILTDAKKALMNKQKEKLFAYDAYKAATEVTTEMKSAIDAAIDDLNDKLQPGQDPYVYPKDGFEYEAQKNITWGTATDSQGKEIPSDVSKYPADLKTIAKNYTQWIAMVDAATIDPNEVAQAEAAMKRAQDDQKAANDAYEAARKGWENLQGIIAEEKAYSVPTTKLVASTNAYSTAFAALDKAIKDWNSAVDKAYQAAYDEAMAGWKLELKVEAIDEEIPETPAASDFDITEFHNQWDELGTAYKTDAKFKQIVDEICDVNADPDDPTALSKAVWGAIELYVERGTLVSENDPNMAAVLDAAKKVLDEEDPNYFDKKGEYEKAISTAETAVENAVWNGTVSGTTTIPSLKAAIAQFNVDAAAYVQLPADGSKQAINVLIGIPDKNGKFSGFADAENSVYSIPSDPDEKTGKITYTIKVTDITTEEIDDATKTKYNTEDPDAGNNALLAESKRVFGINEARYAAPSRETIEAALAENTKGLTPGTPAYENNEYVRMYKASFAAKAFAADDKVAGLQNQIDASDDLNVLHTELVAAQAAFKKSVEDQYAANFGELEAAVTAATTDLAQKQEALDAEDAKHEDIEVEIAKLNAQINATEKLKKVLAEAAWNHLGINWPESTDSPTPGADEKYTQPSGNEYNPNDFAKDLQEAINQQKLVVANAEKAVQEAEADLQKAQAQGYNGVDQAQLYVNIASLKKTNAEEAYAQALDNLEKAMEVLAGTTEAE